MVGATSAAMTKAIFSVFILSRHIPQGGMDKVILITALQTAQALTWQYCSTEIEGEKVVIPPKLTNARI